jgi:hypothetical protein
MSALLVPLGLCCIVLGIQAALNIRRAAERGAKRNRDEDPAILNGPLHHGGQSLPIAPRTVAGMRIGALTAVAAVALVVTGMSGE